MQQTRILLVDDHQIVLDGLRTLLTSQDKFNVVDEALSGQAAVALAKRHQPDVIIMDINLPDLSGIEATRQILAQGSKSKVIGLSMHSDIRMVGQMLQAGALGYLLKDCAFEELIHAIGVVLTHQVYIGRNLSEQVVGDYLRHVGQGRETVFSLLSEREREVLQLLAEGKTTKQIAAMLHLSAKTVETHRQQLMEKLQIHSVAKLTKYAISQGLTSLEF